MNIKKEKHSTEMKKIIKDYNNSVDISLCNFIKDVREGRDTLPLTVGFVSEEMAIEIYNLTGLSVEGNRIVIGADDIRHILNRHGKEGKADNSMANDKDIARLSYVLSNYDSIEWNGETHSITEWSKITGLKRSTLRNRYWRGDRGERLFEKERYNR